MTENEGLDLWRRMVTDTGFWFVDIPRTGSSSLRVELGRRYGAAHGKQNVIDPELRTAQLVADHLPARVVKAHLGPEVWDGLFTFAFVRDPWTRTESMWRWRMRKGNVPLNLPLSSYVRGVARGDSELCRYAPHVASCRSFLVDESGTMLVSYVADFAERAAHLAEIRRHLPGQPELGVVRTQGAPQSGSADWSSSLIDLIGHVYREDVDAFKFSPPRRILERAHRDA